eukprot:gene8090-10097_t
MSAVRPRRQIAAIRSGDKEVDCTFIVIKQESTSTTRDGQRVINWRVADESGSILLSAFGELGETIREADILRLRRGFARLLFATEVTHDS